CRSSSTFCCGDRAPTPMCPRPLLRLPRGQPLRVVSRRTSSVSSGSTLSPSRIPSSSASPQILRYPGPVCRGSARCPASRVCEAPQNVVELEQEVDVVADPLLKGVRRDTGLRHAELPQVRLHNVPRELTRRLVEAHDRPLPLDPPAYASVDHPAASHRALV